MTSEQELVAVVKSTAVLLAVLSLPLFAQTAAVPLPDSPTPAEYRERVLMTSQFGQTQQMRADAAKRPRAFASTTASTSPAPPPWYANPTITVPESAVRRVPGGGLEVALTNQVKSDADNATRWAAGANAACSDCSYASYADGRGKMVGAYDYLVGNGAVYRAWAEHSGGEDPVKWLCEAGYDSPLATYLESWTFNRRADELDAGLTEAAVIYNGKQYAAQILPVGCLAGCRVYARVACAAPHQNTIIALRKPGAQAFGKCVWLLASDQHRGGEFKCPSGGAQ